MRKADLVVAIVMGLLMPSGPASSEEAPTDPEIYIPFCKKPPVIDGKVLPEEWQQASAISMLVWGNLRAEQPRFFVCWDGKNIYVAMESIESSTNTIVASCVKNDHMSIIGNDCVELMIGPGPAEDVGRFDFPTYYFAMNAIGTLWDAKFYANLAEMHNSWQSGAEIANTVNGTYWACEVRIPLDVIAKKLPQDGDRWRMNFDRTYAGYKWSAWKSGGLNDARTGGNVTFDSRAAAVRLLSPGKLVDGKLKVAMEIANSTPKPQKVKVKLKCTGEQEKGKGVVTVGTDEKEVTVEPGKVAEVGLGRDQRLLSFNRLTLEATDEAGRRLFYLPRKVNVPAQRIPKKLAPKVPLVYIWPRFLPSVERLAVVVDYTAWVKKSGHVGDSPKAEIRVWRKESQDGEPVLTGTLETFHDNQGTWRHSTEKLAEGDYTVNVKVRTPGGDLLADYDDWFEKRIFDWMVKPRGVGEEVPTPYTPLVVAGNEVKPWGRSYRFAPTGLPAGVTSQGKELLTGEVTLIAEVEGRPVKLRTVKPFTVAGAKPTEVRGSSALEAGHLKLELESATEYDGFMLFRLTYSPKDGPVTLSRLRLRVPMAARYAKFFSASGDTQGTSILGDLIPKDQGKVFDSFDDTRSVCCSPSFCSLYWVADYETCFCYASDNDRGWVLRDDAPALEVHREGDELVMWLNLVDREYTLTAPRTLEFGFQAGPLKPLPEGWRGIQDRGNPEDAPFRVSLAPQAGSGHTLAGGTHFIHPGTSPELQQKERERLGRVIEGRNRAVVGYHYWGTVPKGFPETRVFRSEWGIDKETWDKAKQVRKWEWKNRFFGDNKDLCIIMYVRPVPSYVDFTAYAYDEALKHSPLTGFYDDTGYPKPVHDEELGLGFTREDGRKVYSSGLWVYRERWKRAAYVNFLHQRPNYIRDSQHVHAHFMPAYGFIGCWAPCERGYYNPFKDRDNLGFYGSIERYVAYNPSRQFGQIPMIGMSTRQALAPFRARDTRCMMMLAMLNDQDVGSFGKRDGRTVCRLRHARSRFKPWEKDVDFTGYWESAELLTCSSPDVRLSVYRRPGAALFVAGNVGEELAAATIEPAWAKLELAPRKLELLNAETGEKLALNAGSSAKGFSIEVPRHDVRLFTAGPPGQYAVEATGLGRELPKPKAPIEAFSDSFAGPELREGWQADLHEGNSWAGILDGRLCVQSDHYGYGHIRRELGVDNVSAQCLIMRTATGRSDTSGGSLFLVWPNGEYVQSIPGSCVGKFTYVVSNVGRKIGSPIGRTILPDWYAFFVNWVRVDLRPDKIEFYCSADGKEWKKDWEVKRGEKHAGAPKVLMLGNGHPGKNPYLKNVISQHFRPSGGACTYFSDLIVGKTEER